jgi:hypothetical protein
MSHDGSWRAACSITVGILQFHFGHPEEARGVTDPGVGSGALLGRLRIIVNIALHPRATLF